MDSQASSVSRNARVTPGLASTPGMTPTNRTNMTSTSVRTNSNSRSRNAGPPSLSTLLKALSSQIMNKEAKCDSSDPNYQKHLDRLHHIGVKKLLAENKGFLKSSTVDLEDVSNKVHEWMLKHSAPDRIARYRAHEQRMRDNQAPVMRSIGLSHDAKDIYNNKGQLLHFLYLMAGNDKSATSTSSRSRRTAMQSSPNRLSQNLTGIPNRSSTNATTIGIEAPPPFPIPTEVQQSRQLKPIIKGTVDPRIITGLDGGKTPTRGSFDVNSVLYPGISERQLVQEVLFCAQGIDGQYLKLNESTQRFELAERCKVTVPVKALAERCAEVGWYYMKMCNITNDLLDQRDDVGLMKQGFIQSVRDQLVDYQNLLSSLEATYRTGAEDAITLRSLAIWLQEPLQKMRFLASMVDGANSKSVKGGALASYLAACERRGDPVTKNFCTDMSSVVVQPLLRMIRDWMEQGSIHDPHNEFFVNGDMLVPLEQLWTKRYRIDTQNVPSYMPLSLAKKILLTGKSINFIRLCCQGEWLNGSTTATELDEDNIYTVNDVTRLVETSAADTNTRLVSLLMDKYGLKQHLQAILRYLLLAQGDFVECLHDLLKEELSKPAKDVYRHNLLRVVDAAVRQTNAQFHDPDHLDRLDVKLLTPSAGETGWDIFTLSYVVDAPAHVVLTPECMTQYDF